MAQIKTETGYIIIDDYTKGKLETLSIGDYGKAKNIKANFLGYNTEINGVPDGKCIPLSEKWVITLSTQYGCSMKCNFCDCPNIPFKGNVSFEDLKKQFYSALVVYPEVTYTDRLNIHFARMGEPTFNDGVIMFTHWLQHNKLTIQRETGKRFEVIHPVFTTMMPRSVGDLKHKLSHWCGAIKNNTFNGQAGLQISINSTDETQRNDMFAGKQMTLDAISEMVSDLPEPIGRKYCLNFAYTEDSIIDPILLSELFSPLKFMVKITPIHNNNACRDNGIETIDGYTSYSPYRQIEKEFIAAGFDVLVFIPSFAEEKGLITCGNAILGGSTTKK